MTVERPSYVEVYRWKKRRWTRIANHGPMEKTEAHALKARVRAEFDSLGFTSKQVVIRVIKCRRVYFANYHAGKQANDPQYRERRAKTARDWQKRMMALTKGDIFA